MADKKQTRAEMYRSMTVGEMLAFDIHLLDSIQTAAYKLNVKNPTKHFVTRIDKENAQVQIIREK